MRYDFIALVRLAKSIIDAALIYYFISHGYGLVAMAVITLITGLVSTAIYIKFTTSLFKELTFSRKAIDLSTLKDVFNFSKWVFVIDISSMLRDKIDIWFIAYYVNSSALTVYYVAVRLVEYALQFLTQATGITGPIFTELYVKGEFEKLTKSVTLFIKLDLALGSIVIVGFILVGGSFIDIWMKGTIPTQDALTCLIVLAFGRFAVYFASPLNSLLMTVNKHYWGAYISIAETLIGAIACWIIIPKFGIIGAAYSIAIPFTIGRLFFMPLISAKYAQLNLWSLLFRTTIFVVATSIFVYLANHFIPALKTLSLMQLICVAPVIVVMQGVVALTLWNKNELTLILTSIMQKIHAAELKRKRHV